MNRKEISENVQRKLYAESMGRCMNPDCQHELFIKNGDIIEKAHIDPYCKTADNSYENLVVLCSNCHKKLDKLSLFKPEEVKRWKQIRKQEIDKFFCKKYSTFEELREQVFPLLLENKTIYDNYYLTDKKELWDRYEFKILVNNKKLKILFGNNLSLFQQHNYDEYSNLQYIYTFMAHVDEFENSRLDDEKNRQILFPVEINSMFGVAPTQDFLYPSTEALECFITKLHDQGKLQEIVIGIDNPYILFKDGDGSSKLFLDDMPRLRQLYHDYGCFKAAVVRFGSLNFALKYISSRKIAYSFTRYNNLREIVVNGSKIIFIYEYCLSETFLLKLSPEESSIIVNLHNWNGTSCISRQAYETAEKLNVKLLTMDDFYAFINTIRHN